MGGIGLFCVAPNNVGASQEETFLLLTQGSFEECVGLFCKSFWPLRPLLPVM